MYRLITLPILTLLLAALVTSTRYYDYIIIGAGPGGLQLGYFMQRANRDYIILERANVSGSFYTKYPRHGTLISINKRNTGKTNKEFNLRHDWNSLISDDESLEIRHYSKEFFPKRDVYVKYLNDYTKKLGLNVQYDTNVSDITKVMNDTRECYQMRDQRGEEYRTCSLVVATGVWKENDVPFGGRNLSEGYHEIPTNAEAFEGQTVLILGRGNAAFETADSMISATNLIHMIARSRVRLSWSTHYVGDLRAVNNGLLDTYQLKSLDAVLESPIEDMKLVRRPDGRIDLHTTDSSERLLDNFAMREPYDRVIRCLGFSYDNSVFNFTMESGKGRAKKYPTINYNYESKDHKNMFFAGTITHSLDFRKSAGGFIHGFRYTTRALHRLLENRNHGVKWPSHSGLITDLLPTILRRINEGSGIYQMFSVLGEVILLNKEKTEYTYLEEFPIHLIHDIKTHSGHDFDSAIVISLEYGANFSGPGKDIFRSDRAVGDPEEAHNSNFLHPVFYYYKTLPTTEDFASKSRFDILPRPAHMHHIVEDFLTTWDGPMTHTEPLRRFLDTVSGTDLRAHYADACFRTALTHRHQPLGCANGYLQQHQGAGQGAGLAGAGIEATPQMAEAVAHLTQLEL